ncbi:MAG: hypothetical protein V3V39_07420 [Desulfobacterales bacterium]
MDNKDIFTGSRYGSDGSGDALDAFFLAEDVGLSAAWVSSFLFGAAALLGLGLLA